MGHYSFLSFLEKRNVFCQLIAKKDKSTTRRSSALPARSGEGRTVFGGSTAISSQDTKLGVRPEHRGKEKKLRSRERCVPHPPLSARHYHDPHEARAHQPLSPRFARPLRLHQKGHCCKWQFFLLSAEEVRVQRRERRGLSRMGGLQGASPTNPGRR